MAHLCPDLDHMVRPLLQATFLLDRSLYGNSPAGYHLLNLILHFASTVLVYRILTVAVAEKSQAIPLVDGGCVFYPSHHN